MAERGAKPNVPSLQRRGLHAVRSLFTPLLPDDYLELIKERDLIMDFNLRSLLKGAQEPYISESILVQALELGIAVVPGDDSHGLDSIGVNMEKGIAILQRLGFDTDWKTPVGG